MRRFCGVLVCGCLLLVGCQSEVSEPAATSSTANSQAQSVPTASGVVDPTPSGESTESPAGSEQNSADQGEPAIAVARDAAPQPVGSPLPVTLAPGDASSPFAPRYSPPGTRLTLIPADVASELGVDGLATELILGGLLAAQPPMRMLVTRAEADQPYTRLYIDTDRNGEFNEDVIVATPSESRGNIWSSFSATLPVTFGGADSAAHDYPVAVWLTVESPAERPEMLRYSRRGFRQGEVTIGEQSVTVVLSDSNNDAVLGEGDWWELKSDAEVAKGLSMRRVGDFVWLGDAAWQLDVADPAGTQCRLVPFDPGMTREQDELARDAYAADRTAVKAAAPLEFRHDADEALVEASDRKMPCFIKFETTWCGPCKMMTEMVFTAKDVVDASEGVMCIKVDGDERKDLVERFSVTAYPTGVMLAGDGTEVTRFVGYQSVVKMAAFLKDQRGAVGE